MTKSDFDLEKIPDWEDNYININKLNKIISEYSPPTFETIEIKPDKNTKSQSIINIISDELKRVYLFYSYVERELYLQINQRINVRNTYYSLGLYELKEETSKLKNISIITYNLIKYVNLNLKIIGYAVQLVKNKIGNEEYTDLQKFLISQVDTLNTDLNYILQYKIIDELSCVLEDFILTLEKHIKTNKDILLSKYHDQNTMKIFYNNEISNSNIISNDNLNNEFNQTKFYRDKLQHDISDIKLNINCIDIISVEFRNVLTDNNNFIIFQLNCII